MLSVLHEALVALFRERPSMAPDLLARGLGVPVPPFDAIRIESADLGDAAPPEYRADLVLLLEDRGKVCLALAIEVQLSRDSDKRRRWPVYQATLSDRHDCLAAVVAVVVDEPMARWAAAPWVINPLGETLSALIVGPKAIPRIAEPNEAQAAPELAVLSVLAHARDEPAVLAPAVAATCDALRLLDEERARLYFDLVRNRLGEALWAAVEGQMRDGKYEYQSEFARKYVAEGRAEGVAEGRSEGVAEGRREGVAEGRREGVAEGRREGVVEGRRDAILTLLRARGIAVSDATRARVEGCRDTAVLDRWLVGAATATSLDEALGDPALDERALPA